MPCMSCNIHKLSLTTENNINFEEIVPENFFFKWPCRTNIHVVPQESRSIVNLKRENQRRITQKNLRGRSNPKEDPIPCQKEVISRCQQENFAPTRFEIQIWLWSSGGRIECSNIWINAFPFSLLNFLPIWKVDSRQKLLRFKKIRTQLIYD